MINQFGQSHGVPIWTQYAVYGTGKPIDPETGGDRAARAAAVAAVVLFSLARLFREGSEVQGTNKHQVCARTPVRLFTSHQLVESHTHCAFCRQSFMHVRP